MKTKDYKELINGVRNLLNVPEKIKVIVPYISRNGVRVEIVGELNESVLSILIDKNEKSPQGYSMGVRIGGPTFNIENVQEVSNYKIFAQIINKLASCSFKNEMIEEIKFNEDDYFIALSRSKLCNY